MKEQEWRSGHPSFDEAMDRLRERGQRVGVVRASDVEREMTRPAMLPEGVERRPRVDLGVTSEEALAAERAWVAAEVAEWGDLLADACTCPPPAAGGVAGVNRGHLLGCPELTGGQDIRPDAINHRQARDQDEHTAAFEAADEEAQRCHLAIAHRAAFDVEQELELLRRDYPDQYKDREPTLADIHLWWEQRQSLTYGGER